MTDSFRYPLAIWQPGIARITAANISLFAKQLSTHCGVEFPNYVSLHRWSIEHSDQFWPFLWDFAGLKYSGAKPTADAVPTGQMFPRQPWFPNTKLNFAENLLSGPSNQVALVSVSEDGSRQQYTFCELVVAVARVSAFLKDVGVRQEDRIAGYLPNTADTVIAMLAAASIGAIWSSCSPDFGVQAVLDRFGQIEPKVLFSVTQHQYNGKIYDLTPRLEAICTKLPSLQAVVLCKTDALILQSTNLKITSIESIVHQRTETSIHYQHLSFDHPLYILYSSGTTGIPKCLVHGAGGTLLQHAKELLLHTDVKPESKIFYYTTCGWMMWNWLVSALACKATVILYDGAPLFPSPLRLFELIDQEQIQFFGTSAKHLSAVEKSGVLPKSSCSLESLDSILSTGSPLLEDQYNFVYDKVKNTICLSSISGGTDIVSCFALGNPTEPVYPGKLQCLGLGMAVDVWDETGKQIRNTPGELVCTKGFPSMPIYFWNDPNGEKYLNAYFQIYPGVWRHGDWATLDSENRLVIHGRSDTTLNPGGVRIGTAEIYRVIEHIHEILESLVVAQDWQGDSRILLFVKLRDGQELTVDLIRQIKSVIRAECSPKHIPAKILSTPEIPRTVSGKIVELAVREIIHGRPVKNVEALANPAALEYFKNRPELLED